MSRSVGVNFLSAILFSCTAVIAASPPEWPSAIPPAQREVLAERLDGYTKWSKARDWGKLYDFISGSALGGVTSQIFVARMKAAHGAGFSNNPDLLAFSPARATDSGKDGYDIYGCAKAKREGHEYNGVAVTHAIFERGNWFFAGWTFTEFLNEPCKELSDPAWEAPDAREWGRQMEELRSTEGAPMHVDEPKNR
jgi:hypothetical protein